MSTSTDCVDCSDLIYYNVSSDYQSQPCQGNSTSYSISSRDEPYQKCDNKSDNVECHFPNPRDYLFNRYQIPCTKPYICPKFNHIDACVFKSLITPLSELKPYNSNVVGPIEIRMRRKNKVVSLQNEPFSGKLTASGVAYLSMVQTICNLPPYPVFGVYNLEYNGVLRQAPIEITPSDVKAQVKFYLNSNGSSDGITANDTVSVKGTYVSWIVA